MSVNLDTVVILVGFPASPSIGLITLNTVIIQVVFPTIPACAGVAGFVDLNTVPISVDIQPMNFREMSTCEFKNVMGNLLLKGWARPTPGAWTSSEFMDMVNAFRAGTTLPMIAHDESVTDLMSDLLNALDGGSPAPWVVPTIGTWCEDEEYPEPIPSVDDLGLTITRVAWHIRHSTDYGLTYRDAEPLFPNARIGITDYCINVVYTGSGVIIAFSNCVTAGSMSRILRSGTYGVLGILLILRV